MKKHELHCTMNPNRKCRMCELLEQTRPDYAEIIVLVPKSESRFEQMVDAVGRGYTGIADNDNDIRASLDMVRGKTGNCPACIMAVYRQAGIPIPILSDFDYKKEREDFFAKYNDEQNSYQDTCY